MPIPGRYTKKLQPDPTHPIVRKCQRLTEEGFTVKSIHFDRTRNGLMLSAPRFYLSFEKGDSTQEFDHEWRLDLETWLHEHQGVADSPQNECERLGYYLTCLFQNAPYDLGEGYLSAVLVETVRERFGHRPDMQETLRCIAKLLPSMQSAHYQQGVDFVDSCFAQVAAILSEKLRYHDPQLEDIFFGSIRAFLDERFSITNQRLLGFLPRE